MRKRLTKCGATDGEDKMTAVRYAHIKDLKLQSARPASWSSVPFRKFEENMLSGAKACKSCRSRQELSNEYSILFSSASIQPRTSLSKFANN